MGQLFASGGQNIEVGSHSFSQLFNKTLILVIVIIVQLLSHVQLFATPQMAARQASLFFTSYWRLLKRRYTELVMPFKRLILFLSLLLLPSIFPNIRVIPNKPTLGIR